MIKRLSFLLSLLALVGCGDCVPVGLSPSEQGWLRAYQPGQQVQFRSNRGHTNVLTAQPLREWHDNQSCNQLGAGHFQPIRSTLVLTSAAGYNGPHNTFSVRAYKANPDRPVQLTFDLSGLLCPDTDPPGGRIVKLLPQALTLANGHHYPAAQLIRSGHENIMRLGSSRLHSAYWDQQAGLLRYELDTGEVFELAD